MKFMYVVFVEELIIAIGLAQLILRLWRLQELISLKYLHPWADMIYPLLI